MFMLSGERQRVRFYNWGIGSAELLQRRLLHIQALVFDNHVHVRMRQRSRGGAPLMEHHWSLRMISLAPVNLLLNYS